MRDKIEKEGIRKSLVIVNIEVRKIEHCQSCFEHEQQ